MSNDIIRTKVERKNPIDLNLDVIDARRELSSFDEKFWDFIERIKTIHPEDSFLLETLKSVLLNRQYAQSVGCGITRTLFTKSLYSHFETPEGKKMVQDVLKEISERLSPLKKFKDKTSIEIYLNPPPACIPDPITEEVNKLFPNKEYVYQPDWTNDIIILLNGNAFAKRLNLVYINNQQEYDNALAKEKSKRTSKLVLIKKRKESERKKKEYEREEKEKKEKKLAEERIAKAKRDEMKRFALAQKWKKEDEIEKGITIIIGIILAGVVAYCLIIKWWVEMYC